MRQQKQAARHNGDQLQLRLCVTAGKPCSVSDPLTSMWVSTSSSPPLLGFYFLADDCLSPGLRCALLGRASSFCFQVNSPLAGKRGDSANSSPACLVAGAAPQVARKTRPRRGARLHHCCSFGGALRAAWPSTLRWTVCRQQAKSQIHLRFIFVCYLSLRT